MQQYFFHVVVLFLISRQLCGLKLLAKNRSLKTKIFLLQICFICSFCQECSKLLSLWKFSSEKDVSSKLLTLPCWYPVKLNRNPNFLFFFFCLWKQLILSTFKLYVTPTSAFDTYFEDIFQMKEFCLRSVSQYILNKIVLKLRIAMASLECIYLDDK